MIIARRRRKGGRRKENEMETNKHEQYWRTKQTEIWHKFKQEWVYTVYVSMANNQLIKVGTGTREEWQEAEYKEKQEKKGTKQEQ